MRLIARGFYGDVGIEKGEVKTGCSNNRGIAVVVLDNLTRCGHSMVTCLPYSFLTLYDCVAVNGNAILFSSLC